MLKDFGQAVDDMDVIGPPVLIRPSCCLCRAATSLGSSCVLNALQVLFWNRRISAASFFSARSSWLRDSSKCTRSFARACHSERRNKSLLIMASSLPGNRPSKAGIAHCTVESLNRDAWHNITHLQHVFKMPSNPLSHLGHVRWKTTDSINPKQWYCRKSISFPIIRMSACQLHQVKNTEGTDHWFSVETRPGLIM